MSREKDKSNFDQNLLPQAYDKNALAYVRKQAATILNDATLVGVSDEAVAGSMAREITRVLNSSGDARLH